MNVAILHNHVPPHASAADRDVLVQRDAVAAALARLGHSVSVVACGLHLEAAKNSLLAARPEVVFNLVESLGGTDRLMTLAALLLEALDIPYTGATSHNMLAVADKRYAKRMLHDAGLPTPGWFTCDDGWQGEPLPNDGTADAPARQTRLIVKAVWEHASCALRDDAVIEVPGPITNGELAGLLQARTATAGRPLFVERFIDGREFNLSLLAGHDGPRVLPPAEIDFSAFPPDQPRIVGYPAKWDEGSFEYHNTPRRFEFARSDRRLLDRLQQLAARCWQLFGLRGYARVDLRVDAAGRPWVLEINVNPCLSPDAGFAAALQRADIGYDEAIERILADTSCPSVTGSGFESAGCSPQRGYSMCTTADALAVRFRDEVRPADPVTVRRLVAATRFFSAAEVEIAEELVRERLQKGSASGYEFVFAELHDEIVGYCCFGQIPCTSGSYDLYWIAVDPSCQRQGIGRLLVVEAEQRIRHAGGRHVYIETSGRLQYSSTREFYQRCGYERVAEIADFYAPGDGKLIYRKVFS